MATYPAPMLMADDETSFRYFTLTKRCPELVRDVLKDGPHIGDEGRAALEALAQGFADGGHNTVEEISLGYCEEQKGYIAKVMQQYVGGTWRDAPWLHGECYLYHLIADKAGFFENGIDYYAPAKDRSVAVCLEAINAKCTEVITTPPASLRTRILGSLWGNKVDLCLFSSQDTSRLEASCDSSLLADDVASVVQRIEASPSEVHLIADNYGFELFNDLILLNHLCDVEGRSCVLHLKNMPYFVSDASIADVERFLVQLREGGHADSAEWARRVQQNIASGKLRLATHAFWTAALEMHDMPEDLRDTISQAALCFVKGDLNYRKLVRDAFWDKATPFPTAADHFPSPVCALRTLKSEVIVGIPEETQARAQAAHPWHTWGTSGHYGVVQYKGE